MAVSLPYLVSYKNVPTLFDKIGSAKIPETFNRDFLTTTIGLKGSSDRALIPLLRTMGFVDQSGVPTSKYRLLKGDNRRVAVADGIREAYRPLFDAQEDANVLSGDKLKGLVAQIAGTDDDMTSRIANTFLALAKIGNFERKQAATEEVKEGKGVELPPKEGEQERLHSLKGFRPEFNYDIHIHLPSNGNEETYLHIFNALRKTFQ
ncbi:DUF5343 domain-containing protein [Leptospira interrogans]